MFASKSVASLITTLLLALQPQSVVAGNLQKLHKQPAKTVVTLAPHIVEMVYTLGAGERIVATVEYSDFPPSAMQIPRIGGYHGLQIEQIMALEPDLIVAWEGGNRIQDIERLEKLGLPVYRSRIGSIDGIDGELLLLGELLGIKSKSQSVAASFRGKLTELRESYASKRKVSFFYQLWSDPLTTVASSGWVSESMEICGGQNIFGVDSLAEYPQISIEQVLVRAPEVILVPTHHGDLHASQGKWRKWPEIPAVSRNQVYPVDGDLLHRFTTRILDGISQVCEIFDQVRRTN